MLRLLLPTTPPPPSGPMWKRMEEWCNRVSQCTHGSLSLTSRMQPWQNASQDPLAGGPLSVTYLRHLYRSSRPARDRPTTTFSVNARDFKA
ncbi:unnamed protein product [Boreogadus saida]